MNERSYAPASTAPTYGGTQAEPAPALPGRQDEIRHETLRKRAEELGTQYRPIEQQASRSRYRKYASERAEAGELVNDGHVTNSTARDILDNPTARATLETEAGLSITEEMTKSQQRADVKSAVEDLASRANGADTAAVTDNLTRQDAAQARPVAQQAYDAERIRRAASALGENGAKALAAAYDGSVKADRFYAEFAAYYEAGVSGTDAGKVKGLYSGQLNEAQKYAAYDAGQNDAAASLAAERENMKSAAVYGKEAGFIQTEESASLPRETVRQYDSVARAVGVKIQISPSTGEGGANGWYANGVIHIAQDAKNPGMVVAKHEITHRMQELAPEEYRKYRDYVMNAYAQRDGSTASMIEFYKSRYAGSGINLSTEQAMDEAAADFTEALATDPKQFERLARQNRSVAQKLLDAVRDFVNKIKTMFKGKETAQSQAQQDQSVTDTFGMDIDTLEKATRLWSKALEAAARQVKTVGKVKNAARTDGAARLSIKYDRNNNPYVVIETDILAGVPRSEWVRTVKDNLREKFPNGITVGNSEIRINKQSRNEMTFSRYMQRLFNVEPELYVDKLRATNNADEILRATQNWVNEALEHPRRDAIIDFARGEVQMRVGTNDYTAQVIVGNQGGNGLLLYDIINLEPMTISDGKKGTGAEYTAAAQNGPRSRGPAPVRNSIDQGDGKVKGKFSLELEELESLREENERLREKAEYWKSQTKVTKDWERTVRQGDVDRLARRLVKDYSSKLDVKDVSGRLKKLGEYLVRNGDGVNELTWSEVKGEAAAIAKDIVDSAEILNDEQYQQYSDLRKYLRETSLILGPEYQADIADFNDFRKRNRGRLNLKTKGSTNIDQVYEEMSSTWPEFFDAQRETHPVDQLLNIADVLDGLRPVYENPFSYDMNAAAEHVANDIIDGLMGGSVRQASTFADRAIKRERERRITQLQRLKAEYQTREAKRRERASDRQARDRLLRIAKRLQNKKLPAANRALLDQYIGDLDTVAKSMTGRTLEKLTDLWEWYADRKVNDPDFIADPYIEKAIARLSKRHISDLSAGDVAALTDVLLHIENEIRTERKLIDSEDRRDTYHMGEEVIRDVYAASGSKGGLFDRFIVTETLSPLREVRRLTGYVDADPLLRLTQELANGQRKMYDYQMKAEKAAQPFAEDKEFSRMFSGPKAESVEITGWTKDGPTTVKITPAMRASLYLHSLNDQNLKHINDGGITVPDEKLYRKGKLAEAYNRGTTIRLTPTQVRAICGGMTAREKAFERMAHDYFNNRSRAAINEVSEKLKGYSIAQVKNYFPINTDTSFTRGDFDTVKFDGSIEGMGFLKDRRNAANPILLRDVNMVLEQSIQQHAKYYGLAIPIRNFNKVWGVTAGSYTYDKDGNISGRTSFDSSVQQAVKKQWGETGYGYIEKMMTDLQNGTAPKNEWAKVLGKARSNYAGAVLTLNASVAMKQAASYPTAAAVLGWRPLIAAFKDFGRVDLDLIAKYTPLQWYRSKGFSTEELGDLKTANKQLPAVLNWVQGADLLTTRKLWKASEYYVRQHSPKLQRGSDAYYRAVADIYDRVIEETQPNYTTMQRPQLLRSDDSLMSSLAMFKTQPFQNFNILYDAAANLAAKSRQAKNGGSMEALKEARTNFSRAVTSQLAQLAVFAGMTMAWSMFRGKDDKYKDDETGELTLLSVLEALSKDMAGGLLSGVPFGSDAWELASSKLFGDRYYGLDAVTVTAITDTVSSLSGMAELIGGGVRSVAAGEEVDWNSARLEADGYFDDISKGFGVPFENVANLFNAVARRVCITVNGKYLGEYQSLKLTTDPDKYSKDYYDLLYGASKNDREAYEAIYADMVENWGFDADKVKTAMETRMKKEQGVERSSDLERRYLSPEQESAWDDAYGTISESKAWNAASDEQRKAAADDLYDLIVGNSAGAAMQEKIDGGAAYGIDEADYVLYRLALHIVDKPNDSGNLGTYTNDEVAAAIDMLSGLSNKARGYLWEAQGKSEKNNPWK